MLWEQSVGAAESVAACGRNVKSQEVIVVLGSAQDEAEVAVGGEGVAVVRVDEDHPS